MPQTGEATPALPSLCALVVPEGLGAARAVLVPMVAEPQEVPLESSQRGNSAQDHCKVPGSLPGVQGARPQGARLPGAVRRQPQQRSLITGAAPPMTVAMTTCRAETGADQVSELQLWWPRWPNRLQGGSLTLHRLLCFSCCVSAVQDTVLGTRDTKGQRPCLGELTGERAVKKMKAQDGRLP